MECPKCHSIIDDNATVCPYCHKVFALECPNCHSFTESSVCEKCGYTVLVKCAKCGKLNPITMHKCSKCKFPTKTSLACQECECDEFASIRLEFGSLKKIRTALKSKELYSKFFYNLKNILTAQLKNFEGKVIAYNDNSFGINFNKELSFITSASKAIRTAIKITNVFVKINQNVLKEFGIPLNLTMTITKKLPEDLQTNDVINNKIKLLTVKKDNKAYLKGFQIIFDQYVQDAIHKDFKTDSIYSNEQDGKNIIFYELVLNSYVLPPSKDDEDEPKDLKKDIINKSKTEEQVQDDTSFKIFDINAKCQFLTLNTPQLMKELTENSFHKNNKIISIRNLNNAQVDIYELKHSLEKRYEVICVSCSERTTYHPWGLLNSIFKNYYKFSTDNTLNNELNIPNNVLNVHKSLFEIALGHPAKTATPEDARFAYMDYYLKFLSQLKDIVILIDGAEFLDDNSIQTLENLFSNKKLNVPKIIFVYSTDESLHFKIKSLLYNSAYAEIITKAGSTDDILSVIKEDTTDFIQSFYFEKIKENWNGNYLYFKTAIQFLKSSNILINFENKLILQSNKSIIIPKTIQDIYKTIIKQFGKNLNTSLILAYFCILDYRIHIKTLAQLEIQNIEECIQQLTESNLCYQDGEFLFLNNYNLIAPVIQSILKPDMLQYLAKSCLVKIGNHLENNIVIRLYDFLNLAKEKFLTLWKNSEFAIKTGDFDAYYKNSLTILTMLDELLKDIPPEDIENYKKEIYNNIILWLYNYSPAKVYYIENILLLDALKNNDDEKIIKLSNLMLQGALITANYTNASSLLHNILSRMNNTSLLVNGELNKKYILLSLIRIEILYNIGYFKECVDIANNLLEVIRPDNIEQLCPNNFSISLFINHLLDTFRLVILAKIYMLDSDIEDTIYSIENAFNTQFREKDALLAIVEYLSTEKYTLVDIDTLSPFSKIIYLFLQEFSSFSGDYKTFAQNIYQAKLLALDLHQKEIELFCDLLIANSYENCNFLQKAEKIYKDVLNFAEKHALFNSLLYAKYFYAKFKIREQKDSEAFVLINDSLALIQKNNNHAKIFYVIFEHLFIELIRKQKDSLDIIEAEKVKLEKFKTPLNIFFKDE